jgi:hypothetical protein
VASATSRLCAALAAGAALALPAGLQGAPAASACDGPYAYAGIAGWQPAQGIAATLSVAAAPRLVAGHVAAWVGVGGRGLGPNGSDAWIQAGLNAYPDGENRLYVEFTLPGREPTYRELARGVPAGREHRVAVVTRGRDRWVVVLDGRRVAGPVRLPGSTGWRPVATAESWNGRRPICNRLRYRFRNVSALVGPRWRPLTDAGLIERRGYGITRAGASFVASSRF